MSPAKRSAQRTLRLARLPDYRGRTVDRLPEVRATAPVSRIPFGPDVTVKAGIGPVSWCGDVPVFHWIVMDVIEVVLEIGFVSNDVVQESTLEDATTAVFDTGRGSGLLGAVRSPTWLW